MYLLTFDLIKKIGAGANFGEGGPEKQLLFFYHGLSDSLSMSLDSVVVVVIVNPILIDF